MDAFAPAVSEKGTAGPTGRPFASGAKADLAKGRNALAVWSKRVLAVVQGALLVLLLALVVGPRLLPYRTYAVLSGSMEPTIHVGSLAVLRPVDAGDLRSGDVITFDRPGSPGERITHRIVGIETDSTGSYFLTRGDANGAPDPWKVPVSGTGYRYAFSVPLLGYVTGGPAGRLGLLVVVAGIVAAKTLIGIWRAPGKADPAKLGF